MGYGGWSSTTYARTTSAKIASGTSFGYDRTAKASGTYKAHEDLDPKKLAGAGSPFEGQAIRESRDSVDHPNSVPIATIFDATGSMGSVPRVTQEKLAGLFGLLLRKGYVDDPQIMIGAYGDAYCDRVPLQISQFESDNRIDDNLDNLFLEGGGGGNNGETQTLAWYYLAYHTATDAWDKRGKKGYAFFVADERALDLKDEHVKEYIGDGQPLGSLKTKDLAQALQEKWEVYILLIDNSSARMQGSEKFYKDLFGEHHVLVLEDPNSVSETIALAIGVSEGTVDLDEAEDDLKDSGANAVAIASATKAVVGLAKVRGGSTVVKGDADLAAGTGATRL